ncbi:uncharacterized protein LOC117590842 [Drosophila guanche]|uniref:Uncharacterized protein n=1 Tax=Drosophila guanche TaxID=7266 RepID=A0A3B0KRN2_DROGU|nr:uncharacterized protein LOC117590842 [Drosophila guanche]XP_034139727.1 uncharacterized protein LOC117590842 [Drosophila guanche]XP_034139728.1 uncharacterized protein LOC117590842 [Drosophila guanche]SPP89309.1 Hypothetical predicted protein [Drosophila guanche]
MSMEQAGDKLYDEFFDSLRSNNGSRNLSQIFEDDVKPLQNESRNMRYQPSSAQKQQRHQQKIENKEKPRSALGQKWNVETGVWTTVIAKVAHAFSGSDDVGRVGVALSLHGDGIAKLILYKTKTKVLASVALTEPNASVIERESYIQFYADDRRFWSLRFDHDADEQDIIQALRKYDLPLNGIESSCSSSSISDQDSKPEKSSQLQVLAQVQVQPPQPQPRSRLGPSVSKNQLPSEECSLEDDVIMTPVPRAIGLSHSSSASSSTIHGSLMVAKMDSGNDMDKKMDTILQAMHRLVSGAGSSSSSTQLNEGQQNTNDSEDEIIELEQKMLNLKRENRTLVKSMRAKEQVLEELRTSNSALVKLNKELKQQNAALLAAIASKTYDQVNSNSTSASTSCPNCKQSASLINALKRQVASIQSAMEQTTAAPDTAVHRNGH